MEGGYLFKAKRIDNGEWVQGNLMLSDDVDDSWEAIIIPTVNSKMFTRNDNVGDLGIKRWYRIDISTICQYTGLKDKDGSLIWGHIDGLFPGNETQDKKG